MIELLTAVGYGRSIEPALATNTRCSCPHRSRPLEHLHPHPTRQGRPSGR